jgi:tetratricopeptide (TPR) repeat protein
MELAREHVDGALHDNAEALNGIAWFVVDPAGKVRRQDLDLALKAAERANELTHGKDANVLDTLARVHFTRGDRERAIELQRKAVELAPGEEAREALGKVLEEYEAAK